MSDFSDSSDSDAQSPLPEFSNLRIPDKTSLDKVPSEIDEANQRYVDSLYGEGDLPEAGSDTHHGRMRGPGSHLQPRAHRIRVLVALFILRLTHFLARNFTVILSNGPSLTYINIRPDINLVVFLSRYSELFSNFV